MQNRLLLPLVATAAGALRAASPAPVLRIRCAAPVLSLPPSGDASPRSWGQIAQKMSSDYVAGKNLARGANEPVMKEADAKNETGIDLLPDTAAAVTGLAVAKAVAVTAAKVSATVATAAVAGPTFKAATVGATLVQIGIDKYRENKRSKQLAELEEWRDLLIDAANEAKASEERLRTAYDLYMLRMKPVVVASDWAASAKRKPARPPLRRAVMFTSVGVVSGAVVPGARRLAPVAMFAPLIVAAMFLAKQPLRDLNQRVYDGIADKEVGVEQATEAAAAALMMAEVAEAELERFLAGGDYVPPPTAAARINADVQVDAAAA